MGKMMVDIWNLNQCSHPSHSVVSNTFSFSNPEMIQIDSHIFGLGWKPQAESSSSSLAEVAYGHVKDFQSIFDRCKTNRKRGTTAAARVEAQTFEDWRPLPIACSTVLSRGPPVHWNLCLNGLCREVYKIGWLPTAPMMS